MTPSRINLLGSHYSILNRAAVHSFLEECAQKGKSGYVCVSNVHTTMTGYFDNTYQAITNQSLLSVPDGVPLMWGMQSLGATDQDRVRGPSLMRDMLDRGRSWGAKHYLYGGTPESLERLKKTIEVQYPGAIIAGAESPPFRPLEAINDWDEIAKRINATGAHFIWVGLGAPKQERWMYRQRNAVKGIMFGIGAAFDILPGVVPDAPQLMQRMGMEWLYRFYKEPKRLWRRYVFNNPAFLVLWAAQWTSGKIFARSDRISGIY